LPAAWISLGALTLSLSPSLSPLPASSPSPSDDGPPVQETVVTATTPVHGSRLPRDRVPANIQTVTAEAIASSRSLDLSEHLNGALGSVHVNQVQSNPLQPDLQYRGFLASPLLGAPQGLSAYINGARLNEPFADTINWDLIPTPAIRSANLMPGSNPIFGLNTLGGALSIETKTGFSDPGMQTHLSAGSFGRKIVGLGAGAHGERFGYYASAQLFDEKGWRQFSPTTAMSAFVSTSYQSGPVLLDLSLLGADTTLIGNAPAPEQLLAIDRRAVFTHPDRTRNRMFMALLRGERPLASRTRLSGTAYFRQSRTRTANGDQREWAGCQDPAQAGFLCAVDDDGSEVVVTDAAGTPVPFDEGYDAADNATSTRQRGYGGTVQIAVETPVANRENHLFVGAGADQGRITFRSQSTVASLGPDRGTIGTSFLDPTSPVAVDSVVTHFGAYASDTFALRRDLFLTIAARFNGSQLSLIDQLGTALTGLHTFHRLNPAAGLSYQPMAAFGLYGGYSESARAPTPVELTCASETDPCRLPNSFLADPPLAQVVARTFELGVRGKLRAARATLDYAVAGFRTTNSDDILFISSGAIASRGYFSNVGQTRRQGVEGGLFGRHQLGRSGGRLEWSAHYTFLDATFETQFSALSQTHPAAVGGSIVVPAGARIPSIPRHVGKTTVTWTAFGLSLGATAIANSGQFLRGDEANLLAPVAGYAVVNLRAGYLVAPPVFVFITIANVFDARYSTFGVLGDASEVLGPAFDSPRFLGPGAPRAFWAGLDLRV
jgi:iron complex outermembrane recepter protein